MLQSPFKSMLARTAIFALALALAISFVTVGLAPSATAQTASDDPCKADATTGDVTCSYDENGTDPVANFSGLDPEGEMIVWSLAGPDAADFDITGGVLSFSKSPNYESPSDREWDENNDETVATNEGASNNSYQVDVVATEVRAPGSLELAQSTTISVTVTVTNVDEDPTFTLDRLQVRAPNADGTITGATVTATLRDPDTRNALGATVELTPTFTWWVPKVSRPDPKNDDHWIAAANTPGGTAPSSTYVPAAGEAGKHLRVVASYTDQAGDSDKAYVTTTHAVGAAVSDNTDPVFPSGTTLSFEVREDAPRGTVVGSVRASDSDTSDILSHILTAADDSEGKFAIDIATGRITVADELDYEELDGEDPRQYEVTVTAYDPSGEDVVADDDDDDLVQITVTDVNEAPGAPNQAAVADRNYTVDENHPVMDDTTATPQVTALVLGTFTAVDETDEDSGDTADTLKLTRGGPDGDLFTLTETDTANTYQLLFKDSPDYESPGDADGNNNYQVSIITTDDEGLYNELALVITVENIDEDGKVSFSTTQPAIGQAITAKLTDPDLGITGATWQWKRSDQPDGGFINIQGATSDTYTPVMSVEDDPITTENEGVDGDEGMYLQAVVTYRDNASKDDDPATAGTDERTPDIVEDEETDNAVREAPGANQAPEFESGITREVQENADPGDKVGSKVTATDPDVDALTYEISGGADMGAFEMPDSDGQITVKKGTKLDFEGTQTTYMVEVTARDPFGLSASTMVTITVTDVNEAPEVTAPGDPCKQDANTKAVTCNYDENGMDPTGNFSGLDPEGEMIVWSLAGPDAADFDITGGVLSFSKSPNYESPSDREWDENNDETVATNEGASNNSYQVDVVATEVRAPGSLELAQSTKISVTVTVTNVDEDPTFTLDRLQVRAPNADGTITGATVTATLRDPDTRNALGATVELTPTFTWWVPKVSRPDPKNDDHWIAAANTPGGTAPSSTYVPAAGEAGKHLRVVASYTDQAGDSDKAYVTTTHRVGAAVSDNTDPVFPSGTTLSFEVREDAPRGTVVGSVRASDSDTSDILSHILTAADDSEGKFAIDIATGRITVADELDYEELDGEDPRQYEVTVTAYDPSGEDVVADDDDDDLVQITVTDVNEAPGAPNQAAVADRNYTVDENHPVMDDTTATPQVTALVLGTFTAVDETDEDSGDTADTLKLTRGGPDGDLFTLTETDTANTYQLLFKDSPDYESPGDADGNNNYQVSIITTDDEGLYNELALVITVENIDEDGKVSFSTTQPAIGQAITAKLTDPDLGITGATWQWKRSDQPDGGFINIQGATSDTYTPVMSVEDDPITTENEGVDGDEGMYLQAVVTYRDNASKDDDPATAGTDERTPDIVEDEETDNAVREAPDANQAPEFESGITREVQENADPGDKVGSKVTATDPDGDDLTYSISGGADMGAFEMPDSDGQITVKKGTKLDFEGTQTTYMVEVTARDPFGLSASTMVTITVTDVNEAPEVMLLPGGTTQPTDDTVGGRAAVSVREGTSAVGTYTTTITSPTWSVSGTDAGDFSISSGGALSFRSAPDYEAPADANNDNVYMVTVVAANGGATSATLAVTVRVTNDPSDDQTGGGGFDPNMYDTNNNGSIDKSEVLDAIDDYFDDEITKEQVLDVIDLYFGS